MKPSREEKLEAAARGMDEALASHFWTTEEDDRGEETGTAKSGTPETAEDDGIEPRIVRAWKELRAALQPESAPAPAEEPRRVCLSCGKTGGDHWPSCPRFAPAPPEPPPAQPKSFPHRLTVYEFAYTSSTPCAVCRRPVSEHPEQVPYVQVEAAQPKGETR